MITGQTLRDAILSGANNIANQRTRVDELNVFPVPDGDTGTNMSMTIGAARAELEAMPDSCTVAEAIEEVKLRSRQYAKRQLTWLRRNPDIHWILWGEEPNFPQGLQNATEYLTALGLR